MPSTEIIILKESRQRALDAAEKLVTARARTAVRPIYVNDGHDPVHFATCTFITVDDQDYLVTCAHVIDQSDHATLFVAQGKLHGINAIFSITNAPSGDRNLDSIDFAFTPVGPEWRERDIAPLTEDDMKSPCTDFYCAYGFPNSRNTKKSINHPAKSIKPTAKPFISKRVNDAAVLSAAGIGGEHYLAIFRDPKSAYDEGKHVTPFEPAGMSGGAIFAMHHLSHPNVLAGLEAPTISCAAIITHKNPEHKLLYGTKLSSVVAAIRSSLPT